MMGDSAIFKLIIVDADDANGEGVWAERTGEHTAKLLNKPTLYPSLNWGSEVTFQEHPNGPEWHPITRSIPLTEPALGESYRAIWDATDDD